jgi:hypothetical protein
MDTRSVDRSVVWSVAHAGLAGAVLTAVPIALSIELAGGGHGTLVPFHGFFGPVWLLWMLTPRSTPPGTWELGAVFTGMVALYGLYGALLARARRRQAGVPAWCACLAIHYLSIICLAVFFEPSNRPRDFCAVVAGVPVLWVIVLVEYFVALHILGYQYARSGQPFRPRLSWLAVGALLAGLLASLACYSWGRTLL